MSDRPSDLNRLIQQARAAEPGALNRLLAGYRSYLRLLASAGIDRSLQGKADPSDVVQDTLLLACQRFNQFRGQTEAELIAWLRQILARSLVNLVRSHQTRTRALSLECDTAMSALVKDLEDRGLLDTTLVVWMGEFGRSPQCGNGGRNHWAKAWSSVLIGGGIRGGQVVGKTDRDAAAVTERPISVPDFLGTVCTILGIDYKRKNHPPGVDRPIPIVDTSKGVQVLTELL